MSRTARKISKTGIYHIMLRGTDRRAIFLDEEDNLLLLHALRETKKLSGFKLYSYCLMGNHVHILLEEGEERIAQIIKRLGVRYVSFYNSKYDLLGHLFQDRYRSEPVETDIIGTDDVSEWADGDINWRRSGNTFVDQADQCCDLDGNHYRSGICRYATKESKDVAYTAASYWQCVDCDAECSYHNINCNDRHGKQTIRLYSD